MATTLADLRTQLAYRLGENAAPSDTNETSRRDAWINEGYLKMVGRAFWWFTEASDTFNSVANQEGYGTADGMASDVRAIFEVRVDDKLYTFKSLNEITKQYDPDNSIFNYENVTINKHWYFFANKIYFLPVISANGTDNISIKYWKSATKLTATSDEILIPDEYAYMVVDFAYARKMQVDGKRGSTSDGLAFYEEYYRELMAENNRRKTFGKSVQVIDPVILNN